MLLQFPTKPIFHSSWLFSSHASLFWFCSFLENLASISYIKSYTVLWILAWWQVLLALILESLDLARLFAIGVSSCKILKMHLYFRSIGALGGVEN